VRSSATQFADKIGALVGIIDACGFHELFKSWHVVVFLNVADGQYALAKVEEQSRHQSAPRCQNETGREFLVS